MRKALMAAALAAASLAAPLAAQTTSSPTTTAPASRLPGITSLTVFGDSLVDAGNINALIPSQASAANGYFDGRFTNGYNYTDYLSIALFGSPTAASLEGGTSFAYGGARATTTSAAPDLTEQLALYQAYLAGGRSVDPTGLFILNFGGNDIFAASATGAPTGFASDTAFLQNAALVYAGAVQTLASLGARNILVTGFPNATPTALLNLSVEGNGYLTSNLAALSLGGTNVVFYDYLDFFARLQADPTQFGLPANLDTTTTCRAAQAFPACTGYFSFDGIHPTTAVHQAVFQDIQRQFNITAAVPEPSTWMMLIIGFAAIGGAMRRQRTALSPSTA